MESLREASTRPLSERALHLSPSAMLSSSELATDSVGSRSASSPASSAEGAVLFSHAPRDASASSFPLAPTTLRLPGSLVPERLAEVVASTLSSLGMDYDYEGAKMKAHAFEYGPAGCCYLIMRVYSQRAQGAQPAAVLLEFTRQRGDPLLFSAAVERARLSVVAQGLAPPTALSLVRPASLAGHADPGLQAALVAADDAAWERERAGAEAVAGAGPAAFAHSVHTLLTSLGAPDLEEKARAGVFWGMAAIARSARFRDNLAAALPLPPSPASAPSQAAHGAAHALLGLLVRSASAPMGGPSSTGVDARTAACMALRSLAANKDVSAALAHGPRMAGAPPSFPSLHALLVAAEALPSRADYSHARRELVGTVNDVALHHSWVREWLGGDEDARGRLARLRAAGIAR
jgi:hypothetical protein